MIDKEGRLTRIEYSDRAFYDAIRGFAGTTYPIGTAGMPSNTIADIITICAARNLKVVDILGAVTFAVDMLGYTFYGHRHEDVADFVSLGGVKMGGTIIRKALVTGAQGADGFLTLEDCIIYALTNFNGIANLCDIYTSMSLLDGGYADISKCNSVHSDLTITVNAPARASFKECAGNCTFTAQDGGALYVRGYKGTLVIDTMTAGTCSIYANGADITINVSCTGTGTINIYGNARVTDNHGAGTTVNDYTKETEIDAIKTQTDKIAGNMLYSMDFWSDPQEEIAVPAIAATLVFTPTVTVADLPAEATIVRAIAMLKFRMIENTDVGVNALDGPTVASTSQVIQVKETTAGAYTDSIKFADNQFTLAASTREGGDCLIGSIDIAGEVDGEDSYTFQWLLRKSDSDFINFNDCQVGLRIWYSV